MRIFFDRKDWRQAFQDPNDPARCHAMCRKLTGSLPAYRVGKFGKRSGPLYGLYYWAACFITGEQRHGYRHNEFRRLMRAWIFELTGSHETPVKSWHRKQWRAALRKVRELWKTAKTLTNSNDW